LPSLLLLFLFLFTLLIVIILVKVYQLSFAGQMINLFLWTMNQWFLFVGFSANIINLSNIPTISQISFLWNICNQTWSLYSSMWIKDELTATR
jgi:hypothetical protein